MATGSCADPFIGCHQGVLSAVWLAGVQGGDFFACFSIRVVREKTSAKKRTAWPVSASAVFVRMTTAMTASGALPMEAVEVARDSGT